MQTRDPARFDRLQWENTARRQRPVVAARLAAALGCGTADIRFLDRERTEQCLELLRQRTREAIEYQLPDRAATIARFQAELSRLSGDAVLLPLNTAASTGAVAMPLRQILEHLPSLLQAEHENLAFMTDDGRHGGIIGIQESTAEEQPRWLQIWHAD